jgi:predicted ArsR family transcriptional regulator
VDRLEQILDQGLKRTLLFARSQGQAVTADDVAAAHGTHRNVARGRLERLTAAGLMIPGYERRTKRSGPGAGRPAKTYRVAPELTAMELPPRRYEQLIALLIEALPPRRREHSLRELGSQFGEQIAAEVGVRPQKTFAAALRTLCAALGRAGFQASVETGGDDWGILATPTCPLRPLVHARPKARVLDEGMWSGLARSAFRRSSNVDVACETAGCHEAGASCRISLRVAEGTTKST